MTRKYNLSVNIVENWLHYVSNRLARPMSIANTSSCWLDTAHYVLSAHVHNLEQNVDKGRQLAVCMELFDININAVAQRKQDM
ncbi:MAG: hypothetical protein MJE68_03970 [Proteobacteria bacterium]|nr:hypothetical protein [Pseudomonadota bacterium]